MQRGDIGDGAQRDHIEQREQVRLLAIGEETPLAQRTDQRDRQQKGDADRGEMPMRGGLVFLVEPVGIDQRDRLRKIGAAFVVIDHDHVDPCRMRHTQRLMRHGTAIDRDDQAGARLAQLDQRFARGAIAFEQAVGDVIARLDTQFAQEADQQRGTRRPIDVVIAIDGDRFARDDRLGNPVGGNVHIAEQRWIGQEIAQGRLAMPFDIGGLDTARKQQLADDIVAQRRLGTQFHIAAAPTPCAAGEGRGYAEYVRKGLRCHNRAIAPACGQRKFR